MPAPGQPLPPSATPIPAAGSGALLGGRYRLIRRLHVRPPGAEPFVCWLGVDEVLERPVQVRVLTKLDAASVAAFLTAATEAGRVTHPGLARVYDAASERVDGLDITYQVGEFVDGTPLVSVLLDAPLAPRRACELTRELAEALQSAHLAGVRHGQVHPGNVLLTESGRAMLTATSLPSRPDSDAPDSPPAGADPTVYPESDVTGLAAVLYAALTGRWPLTSPAPLEVGLPAAPRQAGQPCTPREVRAGVPRAVDAVVRRALPGQPRTGLPAITTAGELARALEPLAAPGPPEVADAAAPADATRRTRGARMLVATVAALAAIGAVVAYLVTQAGSPGRPPPAFRSSQAATPEPLVAVPPATVTSFDPAPGDGPEHPELTGLSDDASLTTYWHTETYATAAFGNLKSGTGLLFDLGHPVTLYEVRLTVAQTGEDVQLRAADSVGPTADAFRLIRSLTPAALSTSIKLDVTARYWLVWLIQSCRPSPGRLPR